MKVLVLNGGSSSLKGSLWDVPEPLPARPPEPLWSAQLDWGHHLRQAELRVRTAGGATDRQITVEAPESLFEPVLRTIWQGPAKAQDSGKQIDVVGHRIVHGGKNFQEATRITSKVKAEIAKLAEFAPEHNRLELAAIKAVERVLGSQTPQIAVFDTAFHSGLPEAAKVYPGPHHWLDQGIQRYGFHGISHQYTSRRAAEILGIDLKLMRLITCHLGNGCSLAAVQDGKSVDTTMGFTPLEGLMMGTRSGSVDPGILIHLVRDCGYTADDLDRILNRESGLKGLSGLSGDMREILTAIHEGNQQAKLAFNVYVHRVCQGIGAMLASLGGLDALVFTAGVGENSWQLRESVCQQFRFLGLHIDPLKNLPSPVDQDIATEGSAVRVLVVHTEEDWEIARECSRLTKTARGE